MARPVALERDVKLGAWPGLALPDPTPKVVRALGPAALGPPDVVVADIGRHATIGELIGATIGRGVAALVAHDPGVRLGDDPEDVHKARVATRRLRSDLRTFRSVLDEAWVDELREELRWIAGPLGDVRDTDVLTQRLEERATRLHPDDRPGATRLVRRLCEHRAAARSHLLEALDSDRYTDLLERLVLAAREPLIDPTVDAAQGADGLVELVLGPWRHLARSVDALESDSPDGRPPDAAFHEVRIRAKRCRYAAEALEPVVGKPAAVFAAAVAEVQSVLGDLHDAVVAEEWLRPACGPGISTAEAFTAGQLAAFEREAAESSRSAWPRAWKRASARKRRDWIPDA